MVISWQADAFAPRERYDAWVHTLNSTYGSWDMRLRRNRDFSASLTSKKFGGFSVTECICDPCTGNRDRSNLNKDDREMLAVQLTLDGLEHMRFGDEEYVLEAGDIIVWDTTQPMTFQVERQLHKISVILPLQRLKDWMPNNWHSISRKISVGSANGILLNSYIKGLSRYDFGTTESDDGALSEATIALLVAALNHKPSYRKTALREIQLERVKKYIDRNLDDSSLTLEMIARANRISLRYLHWIFRSTEQTVSQYILQERLSRCKRDLMNPLMLDRTIATVALSWGFKDPTHFSRRFKEFCGHCPSDLRAEARAAHHENYARP